MNEANESEINKVKSEEPKPQNSYANSSNESGSPSATSQIKTDVEYQTLRQELLETFTRQINTISLGLTATVVILGYGLSNKNPYIFLAQS